MTDNFILDSIQPRTDQLNADSLLGGPIDVTITAVKKGNAEQPIVIEIDGDHQPYKPSKSMRRVLLSLFSDDPAKWVGQRLRLFCNPEIKFGGLRVGGIQISHASIDSKRTILLTVSRGKRSEFVIEPMPKSETKQAPSKTIEERIAAAMASIKSVSELSKLEGLKIRLEGLLSECTQEQATPIYNALDEAKSVLENA